MDLAQLKNGLNIYCIDEDVVEQFKKAMENGTIDAKNSGYTENMLKKILLATSATKYTNHTLCVAKTTEKEILEKTKYNSINEFFKEECNEKDSTKLVGWEALSYYEYDLYFETDNIFYFKDEKGLVKEDEKNEYYIGIMGAIEIEGNLGIGFTYVDRENFEKAKEEYLNLTPKNKRKDEEKQKLLSKYTIDENGNFIVYKLIENANEYEFELKKDGEIFFMQEGCETETVLSDVTDVVVREEDRGYIADIGGDSAYQIEEVAFSINENVDISQYSLSIELLVDMLNLTGSPEYVEEFIDYALDNIKIKFKAYNLVTETEEYEYEEFNIDTDFVMEIYEMIIATGDLNKDNMKAYKSLIFDRKYEGKPFNGSVVDLPDFENINYNSDTYNVNKISEHLKTAYDPGEDFTINNIKVIQKQIKRTFENQLQFEVSSVSTWYADLEFEDLEVKTDYFIEDIEVTDSDYYAYSYDSEGRVVAEPNKEEVTNIFIGKRPAMQIEVETEGNVKVVENTFLNMFANDLFKGYGEKNSMKFRYFIARGLGKIAIEDKGTKNDSVDSLTNFTDYIYTKYTKNNIEVSRSKQKRKEQYIESNTNLPSIDLSKINDFLSLWKNETGETENRNYKSDGKKVEYEDIYEGKIKVGDIFESAPEMFFSLLESSENTRDLVDIFKYIMYVYTGIDYGITEVSQLGAILQTKDIYIGSGFIVKTDAENAAPVLTREQLEIAISKHNDSVKMNLLSALGGFMDIQDNYKVNAVFAMAVARTESSAGVNWGRISKETNNWMSVQGTYKGETWTGKDGQNWRKYASFDIATRDFGDLIKGEIYFGSGLYDVASIGQRYCPPGNAWTNTVTSIMKEIYSKAGIEVKAVSGGNATGGMEVAEEDISTFAVGERTYKNYKQIVEAYKNIPLANFKDANLYNHGCAITSVAIIATGFGKNVTPEDVNEHYKKYSAAIHCQGLSDYTGLRCTQETKDIKDGIINQLNRGFPVMVHVKANKGTYATENGHYFTILSISEDGSQVYVSDPASTRSSRNGWQNISMLNDDSLDQYFKME